MDAVSFLSRADSMWRSLAICAGLQCNLRHVIVCFASDCVVFCIKIFILFMDCKNKVNLVYSQYCSTHIYHELVFSLTAYCFFENKPEVLSVYVEKIKVVRNICIINLS